MSFRRLPYRLYLRILLHFVLGWFGVGLAGSLVFGQVQLLLDLPLAEGQLLIPLFVLEGSADFAFEFFGALVAIQNVRFQPGGPFLEALSGRFERTDCAQRRVGDAGAVTVLAAHNDFRIAVQSRAKKQVKPGKTANANIVAKTALELRGTPQDQLAGDTTVIDGLTIDFDVEVVPGHVLAYRDVLTQIRQAHRESLGVLARLEEISANPVLLLGMGRAKSGKPDQLGVNLRFFDHERIAGSDGFHFGVSQRGGFKVFQATDRHIAAHYLGDELRFGLQRLPHIRVERAFTDVAINLDDWILIALPENPSLPLFYVGRPPRSVKMMKRDEA